MKTIIVMDLLEFDHRQGCPRVGITEALAGRINATHLVGVYIFRNAAWWRSPDAYSEPPVDHPKLLCEGRLHYVRAMIEVEVDAWTQYRADLADQAAAAMRYDNFAPPTDADYKPLEEGQLRIDALVIERDNLLAEMETFRDPEQVRIEKVIQAQQAERRQKASNAYAALASFGSPVGRTRRMPAVPTAEELAAIGSKPDPTTRYLPIQK